jgi:hypothetical protein
MFLFIIFVPVHSILVLIKHAWLDRLSLLMFIPFASGITSGKSSINSGMSAGLSRNFGRTPEGCLLSAIALRQCG